MTANILLIGIGATALIDVWALARRRLFGTALPDFALTGRWIGHFAHGKFRHESIKTAPAVPGELALGWISHYQIGIAFAALLWLAGGAAWFARPTPWLALVVGISTVLVPFFVVQPAIGAGFAASRTPNPASARVQSLITHAIFGVGLYASAEALFLFTGR